MINCINIINDQQCQNKANYGLIINKIPIYCKQCSDCQNIQRQNEGIDLFIDLKHILCILCKKVRASFGLEQDRKVKYCAGCVKSINQELKNKNCQQYIILYQSKHKRNKKCELCQLKIPKYGLQSNRKLIYCSPCAQNVNKDRIINNQEIYTRIHHNPNKQKSLCTLCNNVQPSFGLQSTGKIELCSKCSKIQNQQQLIQQKELYVCLTCQQCAVCNSNYPSYGLQESNILICSKCSKIQNIQRQQLGLELYKDIKNKKCQLCQKIQPVYGLTSNKQLTHCKTCSLIINKERQKLGLELLIDIFNKKCIRCRNIQPTYGSMQDKKPILCKKCSDYENINRKQNNQDLYVDVINKFCKQQYCQTRANPKKCYKGFCVRCFGYNFPDEPITKNIKVKELQIVDIVLKQFSEEYKIQTNKIIQDACSKRRPDILFSLPMYNLIIEIDESQHKGYETTCELSRIHQLYEDLGHMPLVIIRFNPDSYTKNEIKYQSCFKIHKTSGILIPDKKELNRRTEILFDTIRQWLNYIPQQQIELNTIYLFYDD